MNILDFETNIDTFGRHRTKVLERYMETGSVLKIKRENVPSVLNEEVVEDLRNRMEVSPNKSPRKLSAQAGISYGSAHIALKTKFKMNPHRISVLEQLHPTDYEKRQNYCHWFNETLLAVEVLDLTLFSDEAWFDLSGYVTELSNMAHR